MGSHTPQAASGAARFGMSGSSILSSCSACPGAGSESAARSTVPETVSTGANGNGHKDDCCEEGDHEKGRHQKAGCKEACYQVDQGKDRRSKEDRRSEGHGEEGCYQKGGHHQACDEVDQGEDWCSEEDGCSQSCCKEGRHPEACHEEGCHQIDQAEDSCSKEARHKAEDCHSQDCENQLIDFQDG